MTVGCFGRFWEMSIQELLVKAGYPAFPLDDDGFPQPGEIIRFFREKNCWTQEDLAKHLNLSRATVVQMEKKDYTLDSLSRRRMVAKVLHIPPAILGLGSLVDLEEFLTKEATPISAP